MGSLAGVVSLAVGLGVAQLVAGLWRDGRNPVVAVGEWTVDHVPRAVKDWAIRTFGTNDKLVLIIGTLVVLGFVAAWLGRLAQRRLAPALVGIAAIGMVGALASLDRPNAGAASVLPAVIGSTAAAAALAWLSGWRPGAARPDDAEGADPVRAVGPDRRAFLVSASVIGAGAVVAGGLGQALRRRYAVAGARRELVLPAPADAAPVPAGADLGVSGQAPFITPNDDFYRIDTALLVPQVSPDRWRLRIHGLVEREIELTFADLLRRPLVERAITLSCVSNEVGGDLVGNALWSGVPLTDLLDLAGTSAEATQIVGRSVDGWTAGFPTEIATDGRPAMVAVTMNGEPLPVKHGFPARLIVPGLYGYVSATKWLTEIELTTWEAFDGYWIPRGWAKEGPIKTQSRIDVPRPGAALTAGPTPIAGVAWAPARAIDRVEVRVDDGPWQSARLSGALSEHTWVQWTHPWDATPGAHRLQVRATDGDGHTQTAELAPPAPSGATGYHTIRVEVT
jgi:DMSO/TMAO reductase YedYZ molybdopterin-dependent catalytic subunit